MTLSEIILQATPSPEIPPAAFWSVIGGLTTIIVFFGIRYITRLDTLLERLDTAVDDIKSTLKIQGQRLDIHESEIKALKETNKRTRR